MQYSCWCSTGRRGWKRKYRKKIKRKEIKRKASHWSWCILKDYHARGGHSLTFYPQTRGKAVTSDPQCFIIVTLSFPLPCLSETDNLPHCWGGGVNTNFPPWKSWKFLHFQCNSLPAVIVLLVDADIEENVFLFLCSSVTRKELIKELHVLYF